MGLITKKQIRAVREHILSNKLEQMLLTMYIIVFALVISQKMGTIDGSSLRDNNVIMSAN